MDPRISAAIGVAAILAPITLCYLLMCWTSPFARCRACTGSGNRARRIGSGWRTCRRCKGHGINLRAGRHLINFLRTIIHGSNR